MPTAFRVLDASRSWLACLTVAGIAILYSAAEAQPGVAPEISGTSAGWSPKAPVSDDDLAAWVEDHVERSQPRQRDRQIDQIGWAKDIREAIRLAGEHNRPVFLFTHDGRINVGRC